MKGTTEEAPRRQADPAARPREVALTLGQAAIQATARAMHTAQLAADAMRRAGMPEEAAAMGALRDGLVDGYGAIPEGARSSIMQAPGFIGGDELVDLLAGLVAARRV